MVPVLLSASLGKIELHLGLKAQYSRLNEYLLSESQDAPLRSLAL
jgi:hypothetical protein